ncbi:MAG: hypothetical protein RMN52_02740 [Anaerolineae bacterium]|nr:hypothetical protein [Candidatus Roseilinea sp.]MDW8448897.1 hypothetical protein [Anaerolineae bacterium]
MRFFDRVKLLIRSTVGGVFRGDPLRASSSRRRDRLLDEARAQLKILQQDLAGAEQRGDEALAGRLRQEIAELQRLLDEVEARRQATRPEPRSSGAPEPASAQDVAEAKEGETTPDAQRAPDAKLDETRIADQIRKLRESR